MSEVHNPGSMIDTILNIEEEADAVTRNPGPYVAHICDVDSDADNALVTGALANTPLITHNYDDFGFALYPGEGEDPTGSAGYVLWWTDYVANDWAEFLPTLPLALARTALLIDAGTREAFYHLPMEEFVTDVTALHEKHAET